jgi:hypothetical protein
VSSAEKDLDVFVRQMTVPGGDAYDDIRLARIDTRWIHAALVLQDEFPDYLFDR